MNKLRKGLVCTVILLFISVSIGTSASNNIADVNIYDSSFNVKENLEKTSKFQTTVYGFYGALGPYGKGFFAQYPNNTMKFREWDGDDFFSAGTWTNDGRFLCCLYENGTVYDVDPETLEPRAIGNGGNGLNGLAYDPDNEKLYGASSYNFYEIDISTGEQTLIGSFNIGSSIVAIAVDSDGTCYAWDVKFSGDSYLYEVDIETGEATQLFSLGVNLLYAQDGDFYRTNGLLYLSAHIGFPQNGGYLCKVNIETEEFTIIGMFQMGANPTAWAMSYDSNNKPPVTTISFDPPKPDGLNGWYVSDVTVTLNATDVYGVSKTYYRVNYGDWEIYYSPFVISEEGDDIRIEYYSVDIHGIEENIKYAKLDIDKTPPELKYKFEKEELGEGLWRMMFWVEARDNISGIERLEFYLNDCLEKIIVGPGPEYVWVFYNSWKPEWTVGAAAYDFAGNFATVRAGSSDISSIVKTKSFIKQYSFLTENQPYFSENIWKNDIDYSPPITTISFDPPEPNGCGDWYVSNVTVTLKATALNTTDNGWKFKTYYRINEGNWKIYHSPFAASEEGRNVLIEYYSVDIHGNVEDIKSATLDIDKTPPEINTSWEIEKIGENMWKITFSVKAWDNVSGVNRIEIYLNEGLQKIITEPGPEYIFSLPYVLPPTAIWKLVALDNAGNNASVEIKISNNSIINKEKNLVKIYPFFSQGIFERFPFIQRLFEKLEGILWLRNC